MNFKYLPARLNTSAKFGCIQSVNWAMHPSSSKFIGVVFFILWQVMLVLPVAAQYTPADLRIPTFSQTTGTVLSSTNGNWVTVSPQQPDNINLLETNLYVTPPKGSGIGAIEFKLVGADGGTAQHLSAQAAGGKGAQLTYTMGLDTSNRNKPFLVTFGKKGQSNSWNDLYCSSGGGGSTGMAWVISGADCYRMEYYGSYLHGFTSSGYLIAAAGGGGGGFVWTGGTSAGQGANTIDTSTVVHTDEAASFTNIGTDLNGHNLEAFSAGGSQLRDQDALNPPTCCADTDEFLAVCSLPYSVFTVSMGVLVDITGGRVLESINFGQGGGKPTDVFYSSGGAISNSGFTFNSAFEITNKGGAGGCGFGGGGAGISNSTFFDFYAILTAPNPSSGGGGTGSYATVSQPGDNLNGGGAGPSVLSPSLYNTSIASVTSTTNPQSGYFAYRTLRDTVPPVINAANVTLYIGNGGFQGLPNTTVTLTAANANVSDNDSVKTIYFSKTTFGCSDVGTTQTVLVSATDFAGNTSTGVIQVTVLDRSHPKLPILNPNQIPNTTINVSSGPYVLTAANFPAAALVDGGCDTNLTIHFTPTTFSCTQANTHQTVNYYYTNSAGVSTPVYSQIFNVVANNSSLLYVDASATGANNGSSWTNAFTHLQDAINYGCSPKRNIYVAQGTYYPDKGNSITPGDRSATFALQDSSGIYGGFPSGGSVFNNRNPTAYPTILDGNIGNPITQTDNSYHVVTIGGNNTVLDGITIQNGYANNNTGGGGIYFNQSSSANYSYYITLNKCNLLNNFGLTGGAAYINFNTPYYNNGITFTDCIFQGNTAYTKSGAVYFINPTLLPNTTQTFVNCQFNANTGQYGGAIYSSAGGNVNLTNCTFTQNKANAGGGAYFNAGSSTTHARNNIFYYDSAAGVQNEVVNSGSFNASYCDIHGSGGSGNWNSNTGTDGGHNLDSIPYFVPYVSQVASFKIYPYSACRNRGNNSYNNQALDLAGNVRVAQDTIDMGVYESSPVVYVAGDAPGGGNGTSWATAYNDLQTGLNDAGTSAYPKDVWTKTGAYYPNTGTDGNNDGRYNTFFIHGSNGVFGGFAGNESSVTQRNIGANPTILSGDLGTLGDNSDNAYHVVTLNGHSPRLDGLIIDGGNADLTNNVTYEYGGAIYDEGTDTSLHPVAANCVFRNNTAKLDGGAAYIYRSGANYTFDFIQCLFYNNKATLGGAVYIENGESISNAGTSIKARFYNCTGINNTATGNNAGGFCESSVDYPGSFNTAIGQFNNCLLLNDGNPITVGQFGGQIVYNNTYTGTNNNDLVDINNPAGADSMIMTADDGFALQPGSNAVNYGNNAYLYPGDTIADITGSNARIKQAVVDAGAYEQWGCLGATKLYVDANVDTANGDGKSWATAFKYLGDALQTANVCPSVDSILIAAGTYYPPGNLNSLVSIDTTFEVARPVKILGGYPSGGGTRNPLQYPVILNGSINTQQDTGNVRHIMIISSGTADTTLIDGITFTGGYAAGLHLYTIGGHTFKTNQGGAISSFGSLLHVNNCYFENNYAGVLGGAVYINGGKFISTRSVYENNISGNECGAICLDGVADTFALTGNVFVHDSASLGFSGAVGTVYVGAYSYADIENNVFALNSAPGGGGGGLGISLGTYRVVNNTFYGNYASANQGGGGFSSQAYTPATVFANNIFWQNTGGGNNDYYISPNVIPIGNATGINPLFADTANPLGADGLWFTADDGLELKPTSPLINSGTDSAIAITTDITGSPRIQLGLVDPGAYEANSEVTRWYVSQTQDSLSPDGASWSTAFQKFQQGVNAAKPGDTVWVAVGTYSPDSTGTSFSMKSDVKIYGGFNATEQSLAQRSISAGHNTILQGNGNSVLVNNEVDSVALLDGFVIANGYSANLGGGMLNDSSSPLIRNVVFTGNVALNDGGGMANLNSSPVLQNVIFNADSAGVYGGAIYNSASPVSIISSAFYNNKARGNGAIYSDINSPLTVGNSVFNNNMQQGPFDIYTGQIGNLTYCMLQYAHAGIGNIVAPNPYFNFAQNPAGFDGLWFTGDDGLYLGYLSAGLNAGSNSLTTGLTTDITGAPRIQNGTVDMGPYESPWLSYCDSVTIKNQRLLYVDGSLPASGDGSSWVNAFSTLGEALDRANACSVIDTILVAQGTYYPTGWQGFTDRTTTFNILRSGIYLMGGFPAGGGERNTGLNNTYLSGDIGVEDSMADNSFHVVTFTTSGDSSGLDGFIITGGNADSVGTYGYGGGIFNNGSGNNSKPAISNCVLLNNRAGFGGGVFNEGQLSGNASATFINCVFTGDSAYYDGGAMYNSGLIGNASPVITNCTFYGNKANRNAGAVYDYGASGTCSTVLLNSILWGNTAGSGANNQIQIYSSAATDSVFYSLIQDGIPLSMLDGGHNISTNPLFAADTVPAGFNGTWFDKYDGLAVKVGSPAVRTGRTTGALATDITGANRLPVPDMGAYQLQDTAGAGYVSVTAVACGSFLSPSYRYFWYNSGIYSDTVNNILGNDTFYTVQLTVGHSSMNNLSSVVCGSFTSPSGNYHWDTTGVYYDTLLTNTGCDSVFVIHLTVNPVPHPTISQSGDTLKTESFATYQWLFNGADVSFGATQNIVVNQNGNYRVIVVNANGCSDTSAVLSLNTLGTQDIPDSYGVKLYPNPNNGNFILEFTEDIARDVEITDAVGRTVMTSAKVSKQQNFNLEELAAGIYVVRIYQQGQVQSLKFTLVR